MKIVSLCFGMVLCALTLRAQSGPDLLTRVRAANELLYSDLKNIVCAEQIERYRGTLTGTELRRIDTVQSKVSFENGAEHYTEIRRNDKSVPNLSSLSGAWSEGEFGTLLRQTETLLSSQPVLFRMDTELNATPAALYSFEVSQEDSPWDLEVDSMDYRIPFHTEVWVSRSSGQILQIERTSTNVPVATGISQVRWSVKLETVELNGKSWLLPKTGEYSVSYADSQRREWNLMSFSGYRRYGSEVTLSFDSR